MRDIVKTAADENGIGEDVVRTILERGPELLETLARQAGLRFASSKLADGAKILRFIRREFGEFLVDIADGELGNEEEEETDTGHFPDIQPVQLIPEGAIDPELITLDEPEPEVVFTPSETLDVEPTTAAEEAPATKTRKPKD